MRRVAAVVSTAAVLMWAASVCARATDFSGKWTVDAEKTAAANPAMAGGGGGGGGRGGGNRGGGGGDMTVTQDAKTLTVSQTMGGNELKQVYNLDGSDSSNTGMGRGGQPGTAQISNATWDGANLKIVTKGANGDTTAVWSLDGGELKIATTRPGRGGGEPTTSSRIYKKAS